VLGSFSRRGGPRWVALALVALALLSIPAFVDGDTDLLVKEAAQLAACVKGHAARCPRAGFYPALQLVPAAILRALGADRETTGLAFAWVSTAAFAGVLGLVWTTLHARGRRVAALAAGVLLSGCFVWYVRRSFGEMLAAFLTLLFARALLVGRAPGAVAACAFGACLTKEPAFVFAAPLGLLALHARAVAAGEATGLRALVRTRAAAIAAAAGGAALAVGAAAALNLYRFASPINLGYAHYAALTPAPADIAHQAAGLWLAPAGGLALYWPSLVATLVAGSLVSRRDARLRATALGAWSLLGAITLGAARWWSPFGWWCWGPRLLLPWMPALMTVLLYAAGPELERALARLGRAGAAVVAASLGVLAAPHVAVAAIPSIVYFAFGASTTTPGSAAFFLEQRDLMWHGWKLFWLGWTTLREDEAAFAAAVLCPALVAIVMSARDEAPTEADAART
jgi:hypothetical protein